MARYNTAQAKLASVFWLRSDFEYKIQEMQQCGDLHRVLYLLFQHTPWHFRFYLFLNFFTYGDPFKNAHVFGIFPFLYSLMHVCILVLLAVSLLVRCCIDWSVLRYPSSYSTVKNENPVQMGMVFKGKPIKGKPITLLLLCVYNEIRFLTTSSNARIWMAGLFCRGMWSSFQDK